MSDIVLQRLHDLIIRHGVSVVADSRRCEALVRDFCGSATRECNLLLQGLRGGVPADLLAAPPGAVVVSRLVRRLEDDWGLASSPARWVVECWAHALGRSETAKGAANEPVATPSSDEERLPPTPRATASRRADKVKAATILAYPESYLGRRVRIAGWYICREPYDAPTQFVLAHGDDCHTTVHCTKLPADQSRAVLNWEAKDEPVTVVVQGVVEAVDVDTDWLTLKAEGVRITREGRVPVGGAPKGKTSLAAILADAERYAGRRVKVVGRYDCLEVETDTFLFVGTDELIGRVAFGSLSEDEREAISNDVAAVGVSLTVVGLVERVIDFEGTDEVLVRAESVSFHSVHGFDVYEGAPGCWFGNTFRDVAEEEESVDVSIADLLGDPESYSDLRLRVEGRYAVGAYAGHRWEFVLGDRREYVTVDITALHESQKKAVLQADGGDLGELRVVVQGLLGDDNGHTIFADDLELWPAAECPQQQTPKQPIPIRPQVPAAAAAKGVGTLSARERAANTPDWKVLKDNRDFLALAFHQNFLSRLRKESLENLKAAILRDHGSSANQDEVQKALLNIDKEIKSLD
jgi:hypothetical protein